jgi:hypothetical protein
MNPNYIGVSGPQKRASLNAPMKQLKQPKSIGKKEHSGELPDGLFFWLLIVHKGADKSLTPPFGPKRHQRAHRRISAPGAPLSRPLRLGGSGCLRIPGGACSVSLKVLPKLGNEFRVRSEKGRRRRAPSACSRRRDRPLSARQNGARVVVRSGCGTTHQCLLEIAVVPEEQASSRQNQSMLKAPQSTCASFEPSGAEQFLNQTCLASPPDRVAYRVRSR